MLQGAHYTGVYRFLYLIKIIKGYMVKDCTSLKDKFPCIEGQFILSRQVGFYFVRYYIPTTLIVMVRRVFNLISRARFLIG